MEEEKNKVWLDEDEIVNIVLVGALTEENIKEISREIKEVLRKVPAGGKVLADVTRCNPLLHQTTEMRKAGKEAMKELFDIFKIKKGAIFSENVTMRTVMSFIAAVTGHQEKIGIFKAKEEALKWLKES